ncbi:MAG: PTS sugar transporter subunit IIA [Pirellulales bacterium]
MSRTDFDVESLARYLRMDAGQVARMAERGKLPGRRIAGQWRFAYADIHDWWETRIGEGSCEDLASFESVLSENTHVSVEPLRSISEILPLEAIAIPLNCRTRTSVITSMVELAVGTGLLWDGDKMEEAVRARESQQSTAQDNGVALLHPPRPQSSILAQPLLALGRTSQGIPFGNSRGALTDVFFLICSVDACSHLWVLARLGRLLSDPAVLDQIRYAADAREVRQALLDAEAEMTLPSA